MGTVIITDQYPAPYLKKTQWPISKHMLETSPDQPNFHRPHPNDIVVVSKCQMLQDLANDSRSQLDRGQTLESLHPLMHETALDSDERAVPAVALAPDLTEAEDARVGTLQGNKLEERPSAFLTGVRMANSQWLI